MTATAPFRQGRGEVPGLSPARRMRGSTMTGFLIGLILGLTIAVVVALFVTQGSAPFVNRAGRAPERSLEPKSPAEAPDPNAPLQSRNRLTPSAPSAGEEGKPPEQSGSILDRLFGKRAEPEPAEGGGARAPGKPAEPRASGETRSDSRAAEPERARYLLQAGAFRSADEAEGMRARLAFVGFEARVVAGDFNGQPVHRVRVGPFGSLEDMNKARARLAENGIEASVVRQK